MRQKYYERFFNPSKVSATEIGQGKRRGNERGVIVWESYPKKYKGKYNKGTYVFAIHGELPSIHEMRANAK
jgi:hypothetical protein